MQVNIHRIIVALNRIPIRKASMLNIRIQLLRHREPGAYEGASAL